MNLFGCKFCDPETGVCDRKNFDSLLWATVTVFQVRDGLKTKCRINCTDTLGFDSGGLEHCFVCGNGEDKSLGSTLFCSSDDIWKLCSL